MSNAFCSLSPVKRLGILFSLTALFAVAPSAPLAQTSQRPRENSRPQAYLVTADRNPSPKRVAAPAGGKLAGRKPAGRFSKPQSPESARLEQQAFQILNRQRAKYNLAPLAWSTDVAEAARLHSENMARYGFLSHLGKDGSSVSERAAMIGIRGWRGIGENIAYNQGYDNPAEFACERWMISVKHRQNVLEPRFKETGIGVAVAPDGTYYFTQVFLLR